MLCENPSERPTASTILAHPFFWNAHKQLQFFSVCSLSLIRNQSGESPLSWRPARLAKYGVGYGRGTAFHHGGTKVGMQYPQAWKLTLVKRASWYLFSFSRNRCNRRTDTPKHTQRLYIWQDFWEIRGVAGHRKFMSSESSVNDVSRSVFHADYENSLFLVRKKSWTTCRTSKVFGKYG